MRVTGDGQVLLHVRHQWADGATHVVFDPIEFLGRLAVLVPRPRINLILYHGVRDPERRGGLRWCGARRGQPSCPNVWDRRSGVSSVWWPPASDRAHQGGGRDRRSSGISPCRPGRPRHVPPVRRRGSRAFPTRLVGTTRPRCSTRVLERRSARRCAGGVPAARRRRHTVAFACDTPSAGSHNRRRELAARACGQLSRSGPRGVAGRRLRLDGARTRLGLPAARSSLLSADVPELLSVRRDSSITHAWRGRCLAGHQLGPR